MWISKNIFLEIRRLANPYLQCALSPQCGFTDGMLITYFGQTTELNCSKPMRGGKMLRPRFMLYSLFGCGVEYGLADNSSRKGIKKGLPL